MEEYEEFGEGDGNIYDGGSRESQIDDGEISPEEEAFMRGYEEAGDVGLNEEEETNDDEI